ncbi:MAG: hypothetical protein ABF313_09725 [Marivita sp.]
MCEIHELEAWKDDLDKASDLIENVWPKSGKDFDDQVTRVIDAVADLKAEMIRAHEETEQLAEMAADDKAHADRDRALGL